MTVSTEVDHNDYTGNGVTTTFPYTFRVFSKTDLMVQVADLNEKIRTLSLDTDYYVTGAGTFAGGSIVLLSPLASGYQISVSRALPVTQETDLRNQGKFFAEVHEDAFDKLTMLIQQCFAWLGLALRKPSFIANYYDALNNRIRNLRDPSRPQDAATKNYVDKNMDGFFKRTLRVPENHVAALPSIYGRRKKILAFNDQGNPIAVLPESGSAADVLIQLGSLDGSKLLGGLGFLTPEMFSEGTLLSDDFSGPIQRAINAANEGPVKTIFFGSMYSISNATFDVPSGVTIIGGGSNTGIIMPVAPDAPMHNIFNISGDGTQLKNFSIRFNTDGLGDISAVQVYGVFVQSSARNCLLDGLYINGKHTDQRMGFSNGVRLTGEDNSLKNCVIRYCSMGATARGRRLYILNNKMDNGYTIDDGTRWAPSKPQWDGITCEGVVDSLISGNVCTNNGQSGIYIGGGGAGYSAGNIITENRCYHNWNRGIDTGISGGQTSENDVTNLTISNNHIRDNRETQLWLYGTNRSRILNNSIIETEQYDELFSSSPSSTRAGLALGFTTACMNNIVEGNSITVRDTTPYSVVYNGTGHKISSGNRIIGGVTAYVFGSDAQRLYMNNVELFNGAFNPSVTAGSGVTVATGKGSYSIRSGRVDFDITITLTASSPTGALTIGFVPGISSATLRRRAYSVEIYNGWNSTLGSATLRAIPGTQPDQIQIVRVLNGAYGQDAAAYALTGCTIHVHGYAEASPNYIGG